MSAIAPLHGPRFRVSGLDAGFGCDGLDPQEAQLRSGRRPGDEGWGEAPPGWLAGQEHRDVPLERGRYEEFYARTRDWVRAGAPAPVDPADGARVLEILEQARDAAGRNEAARHSVELP
jgi:predicted dehydrogenase